MEKILEQYGRVTVYMEGNHPSPMYHVDGGVEPNPYGNLAVLLEDDNLEEVMYNGGAQCVKVAHRDHGMCRTNVWVDDQSGLEIAKNIAAFTSVPLGDGPGMVPIFDGRLPDGSRVNGTIPPVSPDGPTLTIRKFREDPLTMIDLIKFGTVNIRLAAMMWVWIEGLDSRPANFVIAGGTGSGKTTISNLILRLIEPSSGSILYHGQNIFDFNKKDLFNFRRKVQVVFQDPYASLNPTMNVHDIISEPWVIHSDFLQKQLYAERVSELLTSVGLKPDDAQKYPHQFSVGQRQRIAIARALALNPEIIICDEAVSSLDVSIQAQIIKLLSNLRNKFSLSYLFIAHDLQVVRDLADRVIVMKSGKIVEQGNVKTVFVNPNEDYTKDLLNASLSIDKIIS